MCMQENKLSQLQYGFFVKDTHFELINELIKPDAKKRLSLGSAAAQAGVTYNIYRNQIG